MREILFALLALALFSAVPAEAAMHEEVCEHAPTGRDFGGHVSMHARLGHPGPDMHPGMHWGYSVCIEEA